HLAGEPGRVHAEPERHQPTAAGPLFRGEGFFMPILFVSTVLLVGPAWCSHLCYIGAWDDAASRRRPRPRRIPGWTRRVRLGLLMLVMTTALVLRLAGASTVLASALAGGFGLVGVGLMLFWSRRMGSMMHCIVFCPIGLLANLIGKLSLFRLRIGEGCTSCMLCRTACRYDALNKVDIDRRRPGLTCTLCGDCIGSCDEKQMEYVMPLLGGRSGRVAFLALTAAAHAVFLGVARI
ncbi:MAG: 4Fe-4S binding protein, partial [bacterium]